jgi:hypothetical protein
MIARQRESKGLTQDDVAHRVPGHYADGSTYRRVELARRKPTRDAAIAILRHGLEINAAPDINRALALLAYGPLDKEEVGALRVVETPSGEVTVSAETVPAPKVPRVLFGFSDQVIMATGITVLSLVAVGTWAAFTSADLAAYMTSVIYASLYAVSVLLESQHQTNRQTIPVAAALAFSIMATSSAAALSADAWLVRIGSGTGLITAFAIAWAAAGTQWLIVRPYLSDRAVVPLRYEPHTAQAAHLKNTMQFLLLASVFWLPPIHAVAVLRRELALGHTAFIQQALSREIMVGKGIVALAPGALGLVLLAIIPVALVMACRLVDNLKSDRRQNRYSILLYTRAALFFGLSLYCLGWYADKLANLIS